MVSRSHTANGEIALISNVNKLVDVIRVHVPDGLTVFETETDERLLSSLNRFSVLLVDDTLENIPHLIKECRKNPNCICKIILLAEPDNPDIVTLIKAGVDDFLYKPVVGQLLQHRINQILSDQNYLEESQIWYQILFENSNAIQLIIDPTSQRILDGNQIALDFYGYTLPELQQQYIYDINPINRHAIQQNVEDIMNNRLSKLSVQHRTKSGDLRDVEVYAYPYHINGKDQLYTIIRDVTETKSANNQLRNQAVLLENVMDAVISTDEHMVITSWNSAAEELYGWSRSEVIGQRLRGLIPTEFIDNDRESTTRQMREQGAWHGQVIQCDKFGQEIHVLASGTRINDENGDIIGFIIISHDITRHHHMQTTLRENNERFQLIYQNAPIMMISFSLDGTIFQVNQKVIDNTGYTKEDLVGNSLQSLFTLESAQTYATILADHINHAGHSRNHVMQIVHSNGEILDVILDIMQIKDDSGRLFNLAVIQNQTDQRKIQEALEKSKAEQDSLLSSLTDPIFVFDANGKYLKIAPIATSKYYYPPDKLIGTTLHDMFDKSVADRFVSVIKKALSTRMPQITEYDVAIDNRRIYFSAAINPIEGRDEVVWVARDITRAKLNELALIETEQQYRHLFEHANDLIFMIDMATGRIMDANKQAEIVLGYSRAELIRLSISDIELPVDENDSRIIKSTRATAGNIILEQVYRKKDGKTIPVETSARITEHKGREVLLSFARDITQRLSAMQAEADEKRFAETLRDSTAQLSKTLNLSDVLDIVVQTIEKVVHSESVNIMMVEGDSAKVIRNLSKYDLKTQPKALDISTTPTLQEMRDTQEALLVKDTTSDPRWVVVNNYTWAKSYLGAPIIVQGETVGFINLDSKQASYFTPKHKQRLQVFANHAAIAIQNAQLFEQTQRYADDLELRVDLRTTELTKANKELTEQIIKRQQAEEKLAEERNILRTILKSLPDVVYVKNRQSEFMFTNRHEYRADGTQEIMGKTDLDLFEDQTFAQKLVDQEQDLMRNGVTRVDEEHYINEAGDEQWIIKTKVPLFDDNGEVIGMVGVNQDVTEIKMAERQLQQLLSSAHCLLWYAIVEEANDDYEWTLYVANEGVAQKFLPLDTSKQDYTQAWLASIPADEQKKRLALAHTCIEQHHINYKVEYQCNTADHQQHWLSEDVQVRQLTEGRWQLVGVCLDVTDSKVAEMALLEANDQLEQRVAGRTLELSQANKELQQEIIERQRAEQSEREQRLLAEALRDSIAALNNTLNIDEVLDVVLDAMKLTIDHEGANIMLIEDDTLIVVRQRGYPELLPVVIPTKTIEDLDLVIKSRSAVIIDDTQTYKKWSGFGAVGWVRSNIKIPIIHNDEVIGILNLDSKNPHEYQTEHAELLQIFANQASIAIQNAQLYQQAQDEITERKRAEADATQRRNELELLRQANLDLTTMLDLDKIYEVIVDYAMRIVDADSTHLFAMVEGDLHVGAIRSKSTHQAENIGVEQYIELTEMATRTAKVHTVSDISQHALFNNLDLKGAILSIPIVTNKRVFGVLNAIYDIPQHFDPAKIGVLELLADQAGIAMQNADYIRQIESEITERKRAQADSQRRSTELELLRRASLRLNATFDLTEIVKITADVALQLVDAECAHLFIYDGDVLEFGTAMWDKVYHDQPLSPLRPDGITYSVAKTGESIVVHDMNGHELYNRGKNKGAIVSIPLKVQGNIRGVMNISYFSPHYFTESELRVIGLLGDQTAIAIQNSDHLRMLELQIAERKRAENAEREQRVLAEALRDTAVTLNQQLDVSELYDTILTAVEQVIKVHDTASIISVNDETLMGTVVSARGFEQYGAPIDGLEINLDSNPTKQQLFHDRLPILIEDTHSSSLWIHVEETQWIRSHISLPIYVEDTILALINLDSAHPNVFQNDHIERLVAFSHQAAIALQNARLVEQIRNYTVELETRVQERTSELEEQRANLQVERAQLRAILNAMRDGVYYTDNNHIPLYINNALSDMTGYPTADWLDGTVFQKINEFTPEERKLMWKQIERHLEFNHFWQGDTRLRRSDGSMFDANMTRTEVKDIDNKRVGIVTVVRDVSLQKQLEEQKSRFIANAAHELRTPIANMKTRLFLMKHKPERFSEHLAVAESVVNWMQSLVENLFDHSRFERGIIKLNLSTLILQDLINMVIENQKPEAERKHINLTANMNITPVIMIGDESRLRQVITNLINNAIHYTSEAGSIVVKLQHRKVGDENTAIISVSDTGIGIDEQHLPHLFQPFYRATDDTKGAGLGLSIAREIVEAHKGSIHVDSVVGQGTTFYVSLPIRQTNEFFED